MPTKANEAAAGKSPLFAFLNQPLKRTSPANARRKTAPQHKSGGLMQFNPSPTSAPVEVEQTDDIPHWAKEPPIQAVITYTNPAGLQQKLHVAPWMDLTTQDMELQATIKQIVRDGGRKLQLDVVHVPTGVCVSRWMVA